MRARKLWVTSVEKGIQDNSAGESLPRMKNMFREFGRNIVGDGREKGGAVQGELIKELDRTKGVTSYSECQSIHALFRKPRANLASSCQLRCQPALEKPS